MAEEFLEPIYKEAKILCELRQVVEWVKVLDGHHANMHYNMLVQDLVELCKSYNEYDSVQAMEFFHLAQSISEEKSLLYIGDKIEHELIPKVEECMKRWGRIETENEEGDYLFETTASGFLTVKNIEENVYYHSTVDPMWEARKQVEYIYNPKKSSYSILGCGLGYFIYQLYVISEGSIVINVFERDERMIQYAKSYGVLDWIPEECINIIVEEDTLCFLQSAEDEEVGFHMLPYMLESGPEDVRQIMLELHTEFCTGKRFERSMSINFYRNIKSECIPVEQFDTSTITDEVIVVAAGPSLDDSLEFLRENKGKKTIVAVGTVFQKLLAEQIEPDIVVVVDPQVRTIKQIEGIEDNNVPMLIGMSAHWKFAKNYKGPKYLVALSQSIQMVQYAKEHEMKIWECHGTVTSLAIETAVQFGAKAIYLVGVDLAYPGGVSHAKGTMDRTVNSVEQMEPVPGVNNQTVYSTGVFNLYRKGIVEKIKRTPEIKYYNMSRIGSRIAGTIELPE